MYNLFVSLSCRVILCTHGKRYFVVGHPSWIFLGVPGAMWGLTPSPFARLFAVL